MSVCVYGGGEASICMRFSWHRMIAEQWPLSKTWSLTARDLLWVWKDGVAGDQTRMQIKGCPLCVCVCASMWFGYRLAQLLRECADSYPWDHLSASGVGC